MTKKTWTESEPQGPGRRYWFETPVAAELFAQQRESLGYFALREGSSAWISYARRQRALKTRRRRDLTRVHSMFAGKDPEV